MTKIELMKNRGGCKDEESHEFDTIEEALQYGATMLSYYGYRVWVDGVEYKRNDFK